MAEARSCLCDSDAAAAARAALRSHVPLADQEQPRLRVDMVPRLAFLRSKQLLEMSLPLRLMWRLKYHLSSQLYLMAVMYSNGNASETKANESFDNGVFFDIEAKQTPSIVSKLFSKRSENIR